MKLLLYILLFASSAFAVELKVSSLNSSIKIKSYATRRQCWQFIANFTPHVTNFKPNDLLLGSLDNVTDHLKALKVPKGEIEEFDRLYRGLAKTRFSDPLVQDTLKLFEDPAEKDRLFVCMMSGNCELNDLNNGAHAYFVAQYTNFETLSSKSSALLKGAKNVPGTSGIKRNLNLLLAKYPHELPSKLRPQVFFTNLLHETRHFKDLDLLSDWIVANRELVEMGLKPDELYSKYIRIFKYSADEEEVISIDNGFWVTFLESRGYAICSSIYKANYDAEVFADMNSQLKDVAMEDATKAAGKSTFLADENITPDTVLTVGNKWAKVMRDTMKLRDQEQAKRTDRKAG